jgi:acyl dehydratase
MDEIANPLGNQSGFYLEDLEKGTTKRSSKIISESNVQTFAEVLGDQNSINVDPRDVKRTAFKGFISTVNGTQMPGPI